jgi:lysophospholipase L1-like esterase
MGQVLFWKDFFLRYKANTVVIYEGDNDLASPKSNINKVVGRFKEFCSELLKSNPKTKIYIISVKPSVRRAARWKAMSEANELLKKYAESNPQITFIDASSKMLKEDGTPREDILKKDKLHMTRKGYDIWKEAVRKELIK